MEYDYFAGEVAQQVTEAVIDKVKGDKEEGNGNPLSGLIPGGDKKDGGE